MENLTEVRPATRAGSPFGRQIRLETELLKKTDSSYFVRSIGWSANKWHSNDDVTVISCRQRLSQ